MKKLLALYCMVGLMLVGCAGKEGPIGPKGDQGPEAARTVHEVTYSPSTNTGSRTITGSDITLGSLIQCYVQYDGAAVNQSVPKSFREIDDSYTDVSYTVAVGQVVISWNNSWGTIPHITKFIVVVVN